MIRLAWRVGANCKQSSTHVFDGKASLKVISSYNFHLTAKDAKVHFCGSIVVSAYHQAQSLIWDGLLVEAKIAREMAMEGKALQVASTLPTLPNLLTSVGQNCSSPKHVLCRVWECLRLLWSLWRRRRWVWVKAECPKYWMVNLNHTLKSVVPRSLILTHTQIGTLPDAECGTWASQRVWKPLRCWCEGCWAVLIALGHIVWLTVLGGTHSPWYPWSSHPLIHSSTHPLIRSSCLTHMFWTHGLDSRAPRARWESCWPTESDEQFFGAPVWRLGRIRGSVLMAPMGGNDWCFGWELSNLHSMIW